MKLGGIRYTQAKKTPHRHAIMNGEEWKLVFGENTRKVEFIFKANVNMLDKVLTAAQYDKVKKEFGQKFINYIKVYKDEGN